MYGKFKYFAIMISLILFFIGCDSPGVNDPVDNSVDNNKGKCEASIRIITSRQDNYFSDQLGATVFRNRLDIDIVIVNTGEVIIDSYAIEFHMFLSDASEYKKWSKTYYNSINPSEDRYETCQVQVNDSLSIAHYDTIHVWAVGISDYVLK